MSAVADKLREARALIERGWCQHDFRRDNRVCATGAIHVAVGGDPYNCAPGCEQIEALLARAAMIGENGGAVINWNDAPERTQADVLAAFDKAIELAEAQQ